MRLTNREIAIYFSLEAKGDWNMIYESFVRQKYEFDNEEILRRMRSLKSKTLTIFDDEYPDYLKTIPHPPFVLYYYGDISLIQDVEKNMSIVGCRKPSAQGVKSTEYLADALSDNFVIVSGLAKGVDGIAHQTTLDANGRTIAILGSGIDYCYPQENLEIYYRIKKNPNCLLISEFPEDTLPEPTNFPERNRLIAAFARGVIITEAKYKSGTSITALYALDMNKDVMVLPNEPFNDSLCNKLISEGARLIDSVNDVYDEIGFKLF